MKKNFLIVVAISLIIGISSYVIFKRPKGTDKQWEVPKKELVAPQEKKDKVMPPGKMKTVIKESEVSPFKRPARCEEVMKKSEITKEDRAYLWETCKIPVSRFNDPLSPLKWWKDEYGYEDEIYEALHYYIATEEYSKIKSEYIGPIKNIALNSKYPKLRERAIIVLHGIDKKKSIPILKEVLRKEVEVREITRESRSYIITKLGMILTEEGEYEYAFPYLMKAKVFYGIADRKDVRAIPYLKEALKGKDDSIKISAAWLLISFGEEKENSFLVLLNFIKKTNGKTKAYKTGIPAQRSFVIRGLGKLKDKRAISVLEEASKYEDSLGQKDIQEAISTILQGSGK